MIWASSSLNRSRVFERPCPPAPIRAMLTLSLGGTKPRPPRTCRGTIVKTPAVAAADLRKARREGRSDWLIGRKPHGQQEGSRNGYSVPSSPAAASGEPVPLQAGPYA